MGDNIYDAVVVGAGPAGMMAAITAARRNKNVLLLDKNKILGAKLLISGKGRCNITNKALLDVFIDSFGKNGRFLYSAFSQFFNDDLINFFESQGLSLVAERGGRVFPKLNNSHAVLNILKKDLTNPNTRIYLTSKVDDILINDKEVVGVRLSNTNKIESRKVVLATGGLSYPKTGSTGDGYRIAKRLGHNITNLLPALVGLETKESFCRPWQGLTLKNTLVTLFCQDRKIASNSGEVLFTHFGVSGPAILSLSSYVSPLLHQGKGPIELSINMKNNIDKDELEKRLVRVFSRFGARKFSNVLKEIMPSGMVEEFARLLNINPDAKASQITRDDRVRLTRHLSDLRLTIVKTRPIDEAIVTKGGVSINEINPKTMESKLIKNLYFAGEVIDVDGKTGGFNLQAAFSTGYVAGSNI